MFRGISLTIATFLALGAEKIAKVKTNASQTFSDMLSAYLDEVYSSMDKQLLIKSIKSLPKDTNKTIIIFTSPQKIANDKEWKECVEEIMQLEILRFVCVDEAYLFLHYGLSFREEFSMPSIALFFHTIYPNNPLCAKIPVMFMTAT